MGQRVTLAKDLAAGSDSASTRFRTAQRPYRVSAEGGFTGTVTIQHSVTGDTTADADATWDDIGTVASGDSLSIDTPVYKLRVSGTHTGSAATVYLLEGYR